ncbi:pyridoxamine 5'-phosphate oxidase family protein [Nocardioides terrisoli]|uniref:pyridoxamine 5'-phosphate oxidase family protein n=1 Tax=Nocardioides terrisoli TaxID=3388267 RepID=UPI00287B9F53|nr:pyridoxamine 5'-phosphate oxidase family protein [Nocardioides marmorisolisilvae]
MSRTPVELTFEECLQGLSAGVIGRVALSTPRGPRIVPVNYGVFDDAIIIRTAPYSELGTYGPDALLAFEVDDFDIDLEEGWSVVAHGRAQRIDDLDEIEQIRTALDPQPWAAGVRSMYLRLEWRELTGRRLGGGWLSGALSTPGARDASR